MDTMRAACVNRYGNPAQVELRSVPKPSPGRGEVSIQVVTTTVSSADWRLRSLDVPRGMRALTKLAMGWQTLRQPVLGTELAGVVAEVGPDVSSFRVGDPVIAFPGAALGAHAEFKLMRASGKLIHKPPALSFAEAACLCFGGLTALHYLRAKARLSPSERVLVLGASGSVGTAALQLARHFGAETTAVCSGSNVELVRSLGAAEVIDYTKTNFTQGEATYDVILDCIGVTSYAECRRILRPRGRLLRVVADLAGLLAAPFQGRLSGHQVISGVSTERTADMSYLAELTERGVYRPVIDSTYAFSEITHAHARVDSHRKRGNVVVEVSSCALTAPV